MDQNELERNIQSYVLQQLQDGQKIESVIDVARQLDVPVTMVDRAMRRLTAQGYAGLPYQEATEY
jgi:DNA-binding transcriptional regulator YhcF (GntR family)